MKPGLLSDNTRWGACYKMSSSIAVWTSDHSLSEEMLFCAGSKSGWYIAAQCKTAILFH